MLLVAMAMTDSHAMQHGIFANRFLFFIFTVFIA
jgi:hypothetical protein